KSHSNNILHNITDSLSKHGANKTNLKYNLDHFYLPTFFSWKEIPITFKLRKFCKNLVSIQTFNKLLQLKSLRKLPTINILLLTEIINSQNSNPKLYSIRNKILLNNLLTMTNLNTRYPLLYLTPNCSYCNQYKTLNTYFNAHFTLTIHKTLSLMKFQMF